MQWSTEGAQRRAADSRPAPPGVPAAALARPLHLLMIARDFPPANTSAALRALTLTERLASAGWRTTVISISVERYAWTDASLADRLPPSCVVRRAYGFDPKSTLSIRGRYPHMLAFPDRDASWLPAAARHALRAYRAERIDAMVSTSPPVTAHCVAGLVQRVTGAPWIAELRDPWNLLARAGALSTRVDRVLERCVYGRADRIVVTTNGLAEELRRRDGGRWAAKIRVVPNGFDEADFSSLPDGPPADAAFTIVHVGSCSPPYRDPRRFLEALRLCLERGTLPPETRVVFVGAGDALQNELAGWLAERQLAAHVQISGRIPHRQALAQMQRASALLLLQDHQAHRTSIPLKAYEYLRSGRPVLAIAARTSDTAILVRGCAGVFLASPPEVGDIAAQLAAAWAAWRRDPQRRFERAIAGYDRGVLATEMLRVIDEVRT